MDVIGFKSHCLFKKKKFTHALNGHEDMNACLAFHMELSEGGTSSSLARAHCHTFSSLFSWQKSEKTS